MTTDVPNTPSGVKMQRGVQIMSVNLGDAPHGMIHQGLGRFGDRVTADHWQHSVIDDAIARRKVEAALRDEPAPPISLDDLIAREIDLTTRWCGLSEISYPGDKVVRQVMCDADKEWKGLTVNDRFRPEVSAKVGLEQTFQFFYGWNAQCDADGTPHLRVKLVVEPGKEFWREDKKAERISIERSVFRTVPLVELANPWDNDGRPYNLSHDAQDEACREVGGEGLSTTEDLIWLAGRGTLERPGKPCWVPVWFRCKNPYGSGDSLDVGWDADGLFVGYGWDRDDAVCSVGAVPRRLFRA